MAKSSRSISWRPISTMPIARFWALDVPPMAIF